MRLLIPILLSASCLVGQSSWTEFKKASLGDIAFHDSEMTGLTLTLVPEFKYLVKATFTGKKRPLQEQTKTFIAMWLKSQNLDAEIVSKFSSEYLFMDGKTEHWMAIQNPIEPYFAKEVKPKDVINLYVYRTGATGGRWIFMVNEFTTGDKTIE